jgi:hypothetical protein
MKCGILRGSTGLFIFFTSIIWNNSVGSGRIKAIGKSRAKVTSNSNGGSILVRGWGPGKERGASSRQIHYMTCFTMAQHIVLSQNYIYSELYSVFTRSLLKIKLLFRGFILIYERRYHVPLCVSIPLLFPKLKPLLTFFFLLFFAWHVLFEFTILISLRR